MKAAQDSSHRKDIVQKIQQNSPQKVLFNTKPWFHTYQWGHDKLMLWSKINPESLHQLVYTCAESHEFTPLYLNIAMFNMQLTLHLHINQVKLHKCVTKTSVRLIFLSLFLILKKFNSVLLYFYCSLSK